MPKKNLNPIPHERLAALIAEGHSIIAIAKICECSKFKIYAAIHKHGLDRPVEQRHDMSGREYHVITATRLAALLHSGASMEDICAAFDRNPRQVKEAIRRRGWPMPGTAQVASHDYSVDLSKHPAPVRKTVSITPPNGPQASQESRLMGSIASTGGVYRKVAEWATERGLTLPYAMQQWHRHRASITAKESRNAPRYF